MLLTLASYHFAPIDGKTNTDENLLHILDEVEYNLPEIGIFINEICPVPNRIKKLRAEINSSTGENEAGIILQFKKHQFLYLSGNIRAINKTKKDKRPSQGIVKTMEHLNRLRTTSAVADHIITELETSPFQFIIEIRDIDVSYTLVPAKGDKLGFINNNAYAAQVLKTKTKVADYAAFDNIGSGASIRWNPKIQDMFVLFHELVHAYDASYGLMRNEMVLINRQTFNMNELRAINFENSLRANFRLPLRHKGIIDSIKTKPLG